MSSSNPVGIPFIELLTVDSTNNYAMGLVRAGMAQHGTAVFAREQTRGKGQRNRKWISSKDRDIAITIVLDPVELNTSILFLLSMAIAVGVRDFSEKHMVSDVKIKWPNDIYWRDRKAAGILIENLWQGEKWKSCVAGIGMNVNETDLGELNQRAVSLKQITGKTYDPPQMAKELCNDLEKTCQVLKNNPDHIINAYNHHLYKRNETVRLKKGDVVFDAFIKGVSAEGQLLVQSEIMEKLEVGDVEWCMDDVG